MKNGYSPTALVKLVFNELELFFSSCPEVANFLNGEELMVLQWYFANGKPKPSFLLDRGAWLDFQNQMREELGEGRLVDRRRRLDGALKKLRARHRILVNELASGKGVKYAFLPWHECPHG